MPEHPWIQMGLRLRNVEIMRSIAGRDGSDTADLTALYLRLLLEMEEAARSCRLAVVAGMPPIEEHAYGHIAEAWRSGV